MDITDMELSELRRVHELIGAILTRGAEQKAQRENITAFIAPWLNEHLVPAPGERVTTTDAYRSYCTWSQIQGTTPLSTRMFLRALGIPRYKSNSHSYLEGVRLL